MYEVTTLRGDLNFLFNIELKCSVDGIFEKLRKGKTKIAFRMILIKIVLAMTNFAPNAEASLRWVNECNCNH